jgi:large subunit ribosomal protein L18e
MERISKTRIQKKFERKIQPDLIRITLMLKKQKKPFWLAVANLLLKPRRKKVAVNLTKINKLTKANSFVIIPGKVLSSGDLEHNVTIAAFSSSKEAQEKVKAKGKIITIEELLKQNPQGKNVKILT